MLKRGMSPIIITVLVILLALGSVTVIYTAVKPLLTDAGDKTTSGGSCLAFDVVPARCTINGTEARVRVERRAGQGTFAGITFSFDTPEGQKLIKLQQHIDALESRTFTFQGTDVGRATRVDVGLFLAGGTTCLLTGSPIQCVDEEFQRDAPACSDAGDNDGDGWVDKFDPGCLDSNGQYDSLDNDEKNNPLFQCSDGVENDDEGDGFDGNDPHCDNYSDDNETGEMSLPLCGDGVDNDGDSWIDFSEEGSGDSDCGTELEREEWYALTECQDGMDNDRDGNADNDDAQCENAKDRNERDISSGSACMNGRDDDGDGLIDNGVDPGCSEASDSSEDSEGTSHNFVFDFANDGFLRGLNWIHSSNSLRVVWDEQGRYGAAGIRHYFHSRTVSEPSGWEVKLESGDPFVARHSDITYKKESQTENHVVISAQDNEGYLRVEDTVYFFEDTMYVTLKVANLRNVPARVRVPFYLGALQIGSFNEAGTLVIDDTNILRLRPSRAGYLEYDFNTNNGVLNSYPSIESYSPISALGDSKLAIGLQYLSLLYLPDSVDFTEKAEAQFNPAMWTYLNLELDALESRSVTIAVRLAPGDAWRSVLGPYKQWFSTMFTTTPRYCPLGPMSYYVAWNSRLFNQEDTTWFDPSFDRNRFREDTSLATLFDVSKNADVLDGLGIDLQGVWGTSLSAEYLARDGSVWSEAQWTNNHLFDPHLDIATDPTQLGSFNATYGQKGIDVFWYVRPCAEVYNADVRYQDDGSYTFIRGEPSRYRDVDLRNVTNRDRNINRLRFFAEHGIHNFYFDAMGCPGDEAYTMYARKVLESIDVEPILFKEGARDRDSLQISQMPLIKHNSELYPDWYTTDSSILISELVPLGSYYAGIFNVPLDESERNDILDKGYQVIEFNCPTTLENPHTPTFCNKPTSNSCQRIREAYQNRYARWNAYGRSLSCPEPPSDLLNCRF